MRGALSRLAEGALRVGHDAHSTGWRNDGGLLEMVLRQIKRCSRVLKSVWRGASLTIAGLFVSNSASAQVVIPYGNFDNDTEKYLVVAVTLAALIVAMWRYFRGK